MRNPRSTTPTGYEPKEFATVSRIEDYPGDPYQWYDAQKEFGERDHRAPITEEVKEYEEIGTHCLSDSRTSETSYFRSQMHFDYSVESIADSDLEDGELEKIWANPIQWLCRREVSAQFAQAIRHEILRFHSSGGRVVLEKANALFSSEQGNLIRSSVFRDANPSNLRGSLLEGNKDHLLSQARSDWRSKSFMSSPSISASVNFNDKRKSNLLNPDENKFDYQKNCL